MSADEMPTPFSPLFRLIERVQRLVSAVALSVPDSFRRGVGADNGAPGRRVPGPSPRQAAGAPPSNSTAPGL